MNSKKLMFVGGAMLSVMSACTTAKEEKPLNIIYIMTDDHTRQAMGCYGYNYANTPNLDKIANEGVIFSNSYVVLSLDYGLVVSLPHSTTSCKRCYTHYPLDVSQHESELPM